MRIPRPSFFIFIFEELIRMTTFVVFLSRSIDYLERQRPCSSPSSSRRRTFATRQHSLPPSQENFRRYELLLQHSLAFIACKIACTAPCFACSAFQRTMKRVTKGPESLVTDGQDQRDRISSTCKRVTKAEKSEYLTVGTSVTVL
jgi:hypothetical protein